MKYLIEGFPFLNVFLIFTMLVGVKYIKPFPFILAFFIYATLHYAYSVPALLVGDMLLQKHMHEVSNIYALLAELVFLVLWVLLFLAQHRIRWPEFSRVRSLFIAGVLLLTMVFVLEGVFLVQAEHSLVFFRNEIVLLAMCFVAYLFACRMQTKEVELTRRELNVIAVLAIMVLGIAVFEVISGFAWVRLLMYDGQLLSRGSGTLFNPNVLGLWGGVLVFLAVYLKDYKQAPLVYSAVFFLFGTLAVYLASSRASMLFLAILLLVYAMLKFFAGKPWRQSFKPLGFYIMVFYSLCFLGNFNTQFSPLSARFLDMPIGLIKIALGDRSDYLLLKSIYGRIGIDESKDPRMQHLAKAYNAKNQEMLSRRNAGIKHFTENPWELCVWKNGELKIGQEFLGERFLCRKVPSHWSDGVKVAESIEARRLVPGKWYYDHNGDKKWSTDKKYMSRDYSIRKVESGWALGYMEPDGQWHVLPDVDLYWQNGVWVNGLWQPMTWLPCKWQNGGFILDARFRAIGLVCLQMYHWNGHGWRRGELKFSQQSMGGRWKPVSGAEAKLISEKHQSPNHQSQIVPEKPAEKENTQATSGGRVTTNTKEKGDVKDEERGIISQASEATNVRKGEGEKVTPNRAVAAASKTVVYDNSYVAMKNEHFAVFILWIGLLLVCVVSGLRTFFRKRDIQGVYALTSLFGFILMGTFVQAYQVFPVWGLAAFMMAQFIVWMDTPEKAKIVC